MSPPKEWPRKAKVDWGFSCGQAFLTIDGYTVAVEGDLIRGPDLGVAALGMELDSDHWTRELIEWVATGGYIKGELKP